MAAEMMTVDLRWAKKGLLLKEKKFIVDGWLFMAASLMAFYFNFNWLLHAKVIFIQFTVYARWDSEVILFENFKNFLNSG